MTRTLTVHNAEITTATVEVKTLTISGKQVTLAVFRQLPRRFPPDGSGVLWGRVNYHPDKCEPGSYDRERQRVRPYHCHFVWQSGNELFRGVCEKPGPEPQIAGIDGSQETVDAWHAHRLALWDELWSLPQLFIAV